MSAKASSVPAAKQGGTRRSSRQPAQSPRKPEAPGSAELPAPAVLGSPGKGRGRVTRQTQVCVLASLQLEQAQLLQ